MLKLLITVFAQSDLAASRFASYIGLVLFVISLTPVAGQAAQKQHLVQGRVVYMDDQPAVGLTVELRTQSSHQLVSSTETDRDGEFRFSMVEAGYYRLSVIYNDITLTMRLINLEQSGGLTELNPVQPIRVNRPTPATAWPPERRGIVSVSELARVPKGALQAFRKAEKAAGQGKREDAIRHLEEALSIHPDFLEAWNNLGAQYIKIGKLEEAEASLLRGLEINPDASMLKINLAFLCLIQKRYQETERLAREALLWDNSPLIRYLLGAALVLQDKELEKGREYLRSVSARFPNSHALLAEVALRQGDKAQAIDELEKYLPHAPESLKTSIRASIVSLREELRRMDALRR